MPEEKTPDEVADLLDKAAQWLEDHRWVRGQYVAVEPVRDPETNLLVRDEDWGGYKRRAVGACAVGAIRIAAGMDERRPNQGAPTKSYAFGADADLYEAGMSEMAKCVKQWGGFDDEDLADLSEPGVTNEDVIPTWNDKFNRTEADVIAMFRRCAERVRSGRPVKKKA